MAEDFEVSNIQTDTYFFYIELGKKTKGDLAKAQTELKNAQDMLAKLQADMEQTKQSIAALTSMVDKLKLKELEVQKVVAEIDKNNNNFRAMVSKLKS